MSGAGYVAALPSLVKERILNKAYRVYVTDALKVIAENTAKFSGGGYLKTRYYDVINPRPEETRTPEEIVSSIKAKLARIGGETEDESV